MRRAIRPAALLAALAGLVACAPVDPAALAREDRATCDAAGFTPDTDAMRLCLLLQAQDRRIERLEGELLGLGLDLSTLRFERPYRHRR